MEAKNSKKGIQIKNKFNPSRKYINKAIMEYLKNGGKIKKVVGDDEFQYYLSTPYLQKSLGKDID